jgi:hypothetical protein
MSVSYYDNTMISNAVSEQVEELLSRDAECALTKMMYSHGDYLSAGQIEKIKDEFQKIKERLLAVSLYMLGYKADAAEDLPNQRILRLDDLSDSDIGVLRFENSGIIHTTLRKNRMIMLPDAFDEEGGYRLYSELLAYYQDEPEGANWIIDFSMLESIPENFWVDIVALNYKLRAKEGSLFLCWLSSALLPQDNTKRFCEFFRLRQIGNYCFSTIEE